MPIDPATLTVRRRAEMLLEARRRRERESLASKYDWYGESCPCGLPPGECDAHHRARPDQRPPEGAWRHWVLMGGRGSGKTKTAAQFVQKRVEKAASAGQKLWIALVNETVKDVRDVQIEGPSGLLSDSVSPPWFKPIYEPSKARLTWPNGSIATIYSAEQPGALRGPQFHIVWPDELAKYANNQQETWDQIQFGLRLKIDPRPVAIVTTTPQPTETFKAILKDPRTAVTRASTFDNAAHLDADFLDYIRQKYEGTRLGRQELMAQLLEDFEGALWRLEMIRYKAIQWRNED